ncbi:MAG TPA: hypothetical protein VEA59_05760 [Patescibacteria group bacterium]|nr:hypothetical protein [Patescibacteria group bacterium]
MLNQQLLQYIQAARSHKISDGMIKGNLLKAGWKLHEVNAAFAHLGPAAKESPVVFGSVEMHAQPKVAVTRQQSAPVDAGPKVVLQNSTSHHNVPQEVVQKPNKGKWFVLFATFVLVVLGGAALFAYTHGARLVGFKPVLPSQVWEKFTQSGFPTVYATEFSMQYKDKGDFAEGEAAMGFPLTDLSISFSSKGFANTSQPELPLASQDIMYSYASGSFSMNSGFEYRMIGKKLYVNISKLPFYEGLMQSFAAKAGGTVKKPEWLYIDLAGSGTVTESKALGGAVSVFASPLYSLSVIQSHTFLGVEEVDGKQTAKFKVVVDTNKLMESFKSSLVSGSQLSAEDVDTIAAVVFDKLRIKDSIVWLSYDTGQVQKLGISANAPSLIAFLKSLMQTSNTASLPFAQQLQAFLSFDATVLINQTFYNIGKEEPVGAPPGAVDWKDLQTPGTTTTPSVLLPE